MNTSRLLPVTLCTSALLFGALSGCSKASTPAHQSTEANQPDNAILPDTYEGIKGVIDFMPVAGDPNSYMKIHHEHIPSFRTKTGVVNTNRDGSTGMRSMTMEFPHAEGVSIDGFNVGDKVAFTFAVNWGGSPAWEVTKIEKLDPDTEISFENAPASPTDTPDDHAGHDHSGHGDHDGP